MTKKLYLSSRKNWAIRVLCRFLESKKLHSTWELVKLPRTKKAIDGAVAVLSAVTGQKPVVTKARKSVAGFKIRAGWPIGCKVTLRNKMMYEFLERLISVAIPRIRDFRGLNPKAFDGRGNYSMGLKEQIVFPEIDYDSIDKIRGLDITLTTNAKSDAEALALLHAFNFPLRK